MREGFQIRAFEDETQRPEALGRTSHAKISGKKISGMAKHKNRGPELGKMGLKNEAAHMA